MSVEQGEYHALGAAEGTIQTREPVEGAYQHVNLLRFSLFQLQNYTLFTKYPNSNPTFCIFLSRIGGENALVGVILKVEDGKLGR